jgi:hypothetical protein
LTCSQTVKINVKFVLLIVSLGMGGFAPYDTNPSLGPPSSTLLELGAKYGPLMKEGQVWYISKENLVLSFSGDLLFQYFYMQEFSI